MGEHGVPGMGEHGVLLSPLRLGLAAAATTSVSSTHSFLPSLANLTITVCACAPVPRTLTFASNPFTVTGVPTSITTAT